MPKVEGDISKFIPFDTFPLKDRDTPPKGKNGWIILLDELPSASMAVQAAAYKLVLDKEIGNYKLHPQAFIACAGNLTTDGAIVNRMGTAMQSRLVHLELSSSVKEWIPWANKNNIDHRIIAYLDSTPENLHKFDPKHNDKTFACGRTWEFLSKLISGITDEKLKDMLALICGTISEGVGHEFVTYTSVYSKIPTYKDIIANPTNAMLSNEPAMLFAVAHMIAAHLEEKDIKQMLKYLERLPTEFQTTTIRNIMQKQEALIKNKHINNWITKYGTMMF